MRAPPLRLEDRAEPRESGELVLGRARLPWRSASLWSTRSNASSVAVAGEQAPRALRVAAAEVEHVVSDDRDDASAQRVRVPEPAQRVVREFRADLLVAGPPVRASRSGGGRPARATRRAASRGRGRAPRAGRGADVPRRRPPGRPRTCARRRSGRASGCPARTRSRARTPAGARRGRPCRARAAAPAPAGRRAGASTARPARPPRARRRSRSPETSRTDDASSRICAQRRLVGLEPELRDEAEPANEPQRVLGEAPRRDRAQHARSGGRRGRRRGRESSPSASRRAIALTVKSRRARSSSTDAAGSTTISKSCRPGPVERSRRGGANSIPAGASLADRPLAREEPQPDEPPRDDEILDPAVRLESPPELLGVDARHEEVGVLRLAAEQLVAHRAADEVGVEPEPADVLLDRPLHAANVRPPARRGASSVRSERDRLDLDERARRQLRDLDGRARRRRVADVTRVHLVHPGEVAEVLEEDRRLDEPVERRCPPPRGSRGGWRRSARSAPRSRRRRAPLARAQRELARDEHEAGRRGSPASTARPGTARAPPRCGSTSLLIRVTPSSLAGCGGRHAWPSAAPSALKIASSTCSGSWPSSSRTWSVSPAPPASSFRNRETTSLASPPTRWREKSTFETTSGAAAASSATAASASSAGQERRAATRRAPGARSGPASARAERAAGGRDLLVRASGRDLERHPKARRARQQRRSGGRARAARSRRSPSRRPRARRARPSASPPAAAIYAVDALDRRAERAQALVDPLVAAVDLVGVADRRGALGAERGDHHRHPGADVRARHALRRTAAPARSRPRGAGRRG